MRMELRYILNLETMRESLAAMGYSIIYSSESELQAKRESYHFKFRLKRSRSYVHGHRDRGIFHSRTVFSSPDIRKEISKILREYSKLYFRKKSEILEETVT
jgi:hypothetical protein